MRLTVPLFYFHFIAARGTFLDEDGLRLANNAAARAHARDLQLELVQSLQTQDGTIVVECEDNGELFEVPLSGTSD